MSTTADKAATRTFWAEVLAKASTAELVHIVETLTTRRASEGSDADSDLVVLARQTLQLRRSVEVAQAAERGAKPSQPPPGRPIAT